MIKLESIFLNAIKEGSYDSYGVADKEFERILGYSTNEPNIKAQSELQRQSETPEGKVSDSFIYKNPKTLENFDKYVRAVAYFNGDLYVAQKNGDFIHSDIMHALHLDASGKELGFLRLIRVGNKDMFFVLTVCSRDDQECNKIMSLTQKRNPQYKIITRNG